MVAKIFLSDSLPLIQNKINTVLTEIGKKKNSPDVLYFENEAKLGVEQVRKIKDFLSIKSYSLKGKIVVLENGENLTTEAQNALLKSIEELHGDNLFLIGATSEDKFLPTILSRCQVVRVKKQETRSKDESQNQDIEKLLSSTIGEKFEYVEKLKDKEGFLNDLVLYFYKNLNVHPRGGHSNFLKELLQTEQWVKQNVNIRAALEYLMIILPKQT